jgi:hypothetical protein
MLLSKVAQALMGLVMEEATKPVLDQVAHMEVKVDMDLLACQ